MKKYRLLIIVSYLLVTTVAAQAANKALTVNFNKISTRQALNFVAKLSGYNMLIDDKVDGNLSLHLHHTNWQTVLDLILRSQHLRADKVNGVFMITPENKIKTHINDTKTELIPLYYIDADTVASVLEKNNETDDTATITPIAKTNSLLVTAEPATINIIKRLSKAIDKPEKQVRIAAQIVNMDADYEKEIGIKFGITSGHHLSGTLAGANALAGGASTTTVRVSDRLITDLPVLTKGAGHLGLALFKLTQGTKLDLELSALEAEGRAQVMSSPRLVTADRKKAVIEAGQEIPYQEKTSSGATSVAFKKAALRLQVVPEVIPGGKVLLKLQVNQDKRSSKEVQGVPAIDTRQITTEVIVANGQTLVLGGIYEYARHHQVQRIPFLGRLPILGALFRHQKWINNRRELLIFITPTEVERVV